jgi:hypothetical protein
VGLTEIGAIVPHPAAKGKQITAPCFHTICRRPNRRTRLRDEFGHSHIFCETMTARIAIATAKIASLVISRRRCHQTCSLQINDDSHRCE